MLRVGKWTQDALIDMWEEPIVDVQIGGNLFYFVVPFIALHNSLLMVVHFVENWICAFWDLFNYIIISTYLYGFRLWLDTFYGNYFALFCKSLIVIPIFRPNFAVFRFWTGIFRIRIDRWSFQLILNFRNKTQDRPIAFFFNLYSRKVDQSRMKQYTFCRFFSQ